MNELCLHTNVITQYNNNNNDHILLYVYIYVDAFKAKMMMMNYIIMENVVTGTCSCVHYNSTDGLKTIDYDGDNILYINIFDEFVRSRAAVL